jgi:hypothetical protein
MIRITFGRVLEATGRQGAFDTGHTPLAGHATPPGHTPGCVGQHGERPLW